MHNSGFTAEGVAAYLEKTAGVPLKFKRPVNVVKLARTVAILVGFVTLIIATWSTVKLVLFSKYLWATLSVVSFAFRASARTIFLTACATADHHHDELWIHVERDSPS